MRTPTFLRDPYRRQLRTRVLACRGLGDEFVVITEDTIAYPGGGGQPEDRATLAGQPVLAVERDGDGGWVHRVACEVPVGPVELELDWERRYDHMQQHSAQHLITALAADQLGLATVAFHLGAERSSIDLDCPELSEAQLAELDGLVQSELRAALPITARWGGPDELEGLCVRSRGLPAGHRGRVRVVGIEGVDRNTCGGTHVANTAELQVVVLMDVERVHGGLSRLHFAAGQRVLDQLAGARDRGRDLTGLLACGIDEHVSSVERLLADQRSSARQLRQLRSELAEALAQALLTQPSDGLAQLHRTEDDLPMLQAIAGSALALRPGLVLLLTGGAPPGGLPSGCFLLAGPVDVVARLGPELAPLLAGRGGGARGRYQGRAERLDLREQAVTHLRDLLVAGP
jgi:Ser-tRNA(Ala) deacylase AlaX